MTNYTIIQNDAITSNLGNGAFRLYCLLQSMCYGEKDSCFPSQNYLAEKLNKSTRTIQRYLQELYNAKLIPKRRRGSISNVYTILGRKILQQVDKAVNKAKNAYRSYTSKRRKEKVSSFNDYEQTQYNFNNLEAVLLGEMEYDPDALLAKD
ncbi:HTH domain protein [Clostridium argentinense CDC 2741]|uniref:HTH domain protein n=1 Tax=Clostridium argentinense CDC 2741 TaxID=1418104 RepID=A0A0C1RCI9_9CLOT|nr:helix-turn-helix domain-containing protein [Clostridium argentinense]ARC85219.1 helix-turn-helix domain-containing protein [Clostridium argentinense]KIE48081.1 HTH domain protein [Clostridium argentinense CDC 2741]NFF39478.1 helix-turn-helix domain-containing protein [Clostridium argentinense]NFP50975.1 helix-turn-helix domain-containing protein [Clostridium argentinense]NFP73631.1 helix-turn-helix domain-containing protein [Clostridium argentinense]